MAKEGIDPAATPYRLVTARDCHFCADLKEQHPEFRRVAPEIDIEEKRCEPIPGFSEGPVCHTGADLLIKSKINFTPACVVAMDGGKVRACKPEEEEMVLQGRMPDPAQFNPRPRKPFKFLDPRDVKL